MCQPNSEKKLKFSWYYLLDIKVAKQWEVADVFIRSHFSPTITTYYYCISMAIPFEMHSSHFSMNDSQMLSG
jgi:hypothetical protein